MNATAKYEMNEALYRQMWADWVAHASRWRKHTYPINFGLILAGLLGHAVLGLFDHDPRLPILFTYLVLLGVLGIAWHHWDKRKWIAARLSSNVTGHQIEIRFEDTEVLTQGPFTKSRMAWEGSSRAVSTPRGMLLWPQSGAFIYVPDQGLEPIQSKPQIIAKICNRSRAESGGDAT